MLVLTLPTAMAHTFHSKCIYDNTPTCHKQASWIDSKPTRPPKLDDICLADHTSLTFLHSSKTAHQTYCTCISKLFVVVLVSAIKCITYSFKHQALTNGACFYPAPLGVAPACTKSYCRINGLKILPTPTAPPQSHDCSLLPVAAHNPCTMGLHHHFHHRSLPIVLHRIPQRGTALSLTLWVTSLHLFAAPLQSPLFF